jgi:hypothetical protein
VAAFPAARIGAVFTVVDLRAPASLDFLVIVAL